MKYATCLTHVPGKWSFLLPLISAVSAEIIGDHYASYTYPKFSAAFNAHVSYTVRFSLEFKQTRRVCVQPYSVRFSTSF